MKLAKINYPDYFNTLNKDMTLSEMLQDIKEQGYDITMSNLRSRAHTYHQQGYLDVVGKSGNKNIYRAVKIIPDFHQSTGNAFDYLTFFETYLQEPKTVNEILNDLAMEGHFPSRDTVARAMRGYYQKAVLKREKIITDDNLPTHAYQLASAENVPCSCCSVKNSQWYESCNCFSKPDKLHAQAWCAKRNKEGDL